MMNVKRYLSQVKDNATALKALELQLAELRDEAIGQGSPDIGKLNIMTSLPKDAMAEALVKYADLLDEYHECKREYARYRAQVVLFLKRNVHTQQHYQLLYLRYIECCTYGDIAKLYGIDYRKAQSETRWALRVLERTVAIS